MRCSAKILRDTFKQFSDHDCPETTIETLLTAFYSQTQKHWHPNPNMHAIIRQFNREGYGQGILSNAAHDADVQTLVDQADIRPQLDFVLTSAKVGYRKPHPETFQRALDLWGAAPEQVLMIGDTLIADIQGAKNSNIRSVWTRQYVLTLPKNASYKIKADYEIDRFEDLQDLVTALEASIHNDDARRLYEMGKVVNAPRYDELSDGESW